MYRCLFFTILLFLYGTLFCQVKDTSAVIPMISFNTGYDIPAADMAKRFGPNLKAGLSFTIKWPHFFLLGADFNYLFSEKLNETGIFDNLKTSSGVIINRFGEIARIKLSERGFYAGIKAGKLFPRYGPNPHCGIIATFSAGMLQHKINIENDGNNVPQLLGDYTKGYDRLTNGLALQQFVGYMFMNNKGTYNFYAGLEFTQGFTQSRRSWDFDRQCRDTQKRIDLLFGIRAGWIIPLYRRMSTEYYYY